MTERKPGASASRQGQFRVLIVDDHPLLRRGIGQLIAQAKEFAVVGEAGDAGQAFAAIESTQPDVALIDISLNGESGIELLKNIRARFPRLRMLVFSMHDESVYASRALRAGAFGYIMKSESGEEVLTALRRVARDQVYLSDPLSNNMLHTLAGGAAPPATSPVEELSDRELEVFSLIGQGHGTRPIAERLHLSVRTIESHRAHLKQKLNLRNATELVHHAIQWAQSEREPSCDMAIAHTPCAPSPCEAK